MDWAHAEGQNTIASGSYSHAEGWYTQAIGDYSHAEGDNSQALGLYSHAEGNTTKTGTQNAYYAESVVSGVITLSGSYSNISGQFGIDNRLYLYDEPFDNNYSRVIFIISQSYYSDPNTIIELYDTSVNTTTAYVGDVNYGIPNWTGDQTIPGDYSHTEGNSTITIGLHSHAEGDNTQAIGYTSHAEGENTQAIGARSHAEGGSTYAIGDYSHAEGESSQTIGIYSHAEGTNAQAIGYYSHAEGENTQAIGPSSHAEGSNTQAIGGASHAEGDSTISGWKGFIPSISLGTASIQQTGDFTSVFIAPGTAITDLGLFTYNSSSFDGTNTFVYLDDVNNAGGIKHIADINDLNNPSAPDLLGTYSHAEGVTTKALSEASHAEGSNTQAIGVASHAEGSGTQAIGNYSHAEGESTQAIGLYSHTEGANAVASGDYSHAEGNGTQAIGLYSHAEGESTIASGSFQHVSGKYNTHGDDTSLFIIGNGADDNNRSDIVRVTTTDVQVTGSLIVTGSQVYLTTDDFTIGLPDTNTRIDAGPGGVSLYDGNTVLSVSSGDRLLYKSDGAIVFDWENGIISSSLDISGSATISNVLTLAPQDPLPSGIPTGSFAVSASVPPVPYFWDGSNWNALY
jgi:hypothetical protein